MYVLYLVILVILKLYKYLIIVCSMQNIISTN